MHAICQPGVLARPLLCLQVVTMTFALLGALLVPFHFTIGWQ